MQIDRCEECSDKDANTALNYSLCNWNWEATSAPVCSCVQGSSGDGRASGTGCDPINECVAGDAILGLSAADICPFELLVECVDLDPLNERYQCTCPAGSFGNGEFCVRPGDADFDLDTDLCSRGYSPCSAYADCSQAEDFVVSCTCRSGFEDTRYTLNAAFDRCGSNIATIAECNAAAVALGLSDVEATERTESDDLVGHFTHLASPPRLWFSSAGNPAFPMPDTKRPMCAKEGQGRVGECRDIDECDPSLAAVCEDSAECTNLMGSFFCSCPSGQALEDNVRCVAINECADEAYGSGGRCAREGGVHSTCVDLDDGYECSCNPGFVMVTTATKSARTFSSAKTSLCAPTVPLARSDPGVRQNTLPATSADALWRGILW